MNSPNSNLIFGALALVTIVACLSAAILSSRRKKLQSGTQTRERQSRRQLPPAPPASQLANNPGLDNSRSLTVPEKDPLLKYVKPQPLGFSETALQQALSRAQQHMSACTQARDKRDYRQARQHLARAMEEVHKTLRIDHWYTADVLNMAGCIEYDEGFYVKAREYWEVASNVASEWPDKCAYLVGTLEKNLKLVKGTLGF